MANIQPKYNFTTRQDGNTTIFEYKKTPVSYKMIFPLAVYTLLPFTFLAFLYMDKYSSTTSKVITWIVFVFGSAAGIVLLINLLRKPGQFSINEKEVTVSGKSYDKKHITSYFIKTPKGEHQYITSTTVYDPTSLVGNAAYIGSSISQANKQAGFEIKKFLSEAGYKICVRFGTKDIAIAKGLGENEVEVMFHKLKEVAGLVKAD